MKYSGSLKSRGEQFSVSILVVFLVFCLVLQVQAAADRSSYILYDSSWIGPPDFKLIAFDAQHNQIFIGWSALDRIDVLSAADYHLIRSMTVPSPSSLDISPDGSTLAVATTSAHILFFDTSTFTETSDLVFPDSALFITAFVYTANGNAFVRAAEGLSTGGGIAAYWDHVANSFNNASNAEGATGPYQTTGPLARSGDYSRIALGDATSSGNVQIIDGNSGQPVQQLAYGGYILALAVNKDASRYAVCVEEAGYGPYLVVLDASFNEIFQDQAGCIGMAFSQDGNTLYRDASVNSIESTQAIDMATFAVRNTTNKFGGSYGTLWQSADATGMVYGLSPNTFIGTAFVAVDTTTAETPAIPAPNDPIHIVRVIDNIGSPKGGDLIRILCTGADTANAGSVSVTVDGVLATVVSVAPIEPQSNLPNQRLVTVKTPPGTAGLADIVLRAGTSSDTAPKAFQYARNTTLFPFSTSPTFLLYDSLRQKLYAAHKDQVEVIDPIGLQVLTPLVPASGKLTNSRFAGMSLSPDGNRLYVADSGANLIHVIDLNSPGTGTSIDPAKALGSSSTISPGRVFETSDGKILASTLPAWPFPFLLDPNTGTGTPLHDGLGNQVGGCAWASTNKGQHVLISADIDEPISSRVGMWNAGTSEYLSSANETLGMIDATANEDGTVVATGGGNLNPEIVDFNLNSSGLINQHFDVSMPTGSPSLSLHASGALLYQAGTTPEGGSVEIDDLHQWQATATVVLPEPFVNDLDRLTDHVFTTDDTGRYMFGITQSGITMMVLDSIPLSIGNLQPAIGQPAGGASITIRGSGFQSGVVASFGGVPSVTSFVDENTLTAIVPALSLGWQDVTARNPKGQSYTAPQLFQVLGTQPAPVITGFSPASLVLAGFAEPLSITVVGSGFDNYDTVEINGQPIDSALIDSSHTQATIPWELTQQPGSLAFTVVSPYAGSSNTALLTTVNPAPVIHSIFPVTLATGGSASQVTVYGVGFVAGSVAQWSGQTLATTVVGGETSDGDEALIASVPGNLLAASGTATITVLNSPPGGGTSNAFSLDFSSAHPVVSYPASIDFGKVLINIPTTQLVELTDVGSANYTVTSVTVSSGPFSTSEVLCTNLPPGPSTSCVFQLQFSPVTTGLATGTMTINDNVAGGPHIVPLSGTGTQVLVPVVTLTSIDFLGQTVSAALNGTALVGGANVPAMAWIEYGTDPALATYTQSPAWSFTGDTYRLFGLITGLTPVTTYAARLVVQTAGGTGRSSIGMFATMPAWPWVSMEFPSGASNSTTVSAGQTATYQLVASDGGNGYTGTATFSCSGAPTAAVCTVTPSTLTVGVGSTPFTVTVTTTAPSSALLKPISSGLAWALFTLIGACTILFPKRARGASLLICLSVTLFLFACGGSGGGSTTGPAPTPSTPPGTYMLTVKASTGGVQNSLLLSLTVN